MKSIINQKFGRLTVLSYQGQNKYRAYLYLCKCDCGNEKIILKGSLTHNRTRSCGCLRKERNRELNTTHGMEGTPIYFSWKCMIQRCTNPKANAYEYYGGRGINVCERWRKFENFYADMGTRPEDTSIDRIDNDGNYELGNCKWASTEDQGNNRRDNKKITFNGLTLGLSQWARKLGVSPLTISYRLKHHPIEIALTAPKSSGSRRLS